ncbi:MAG: division/cell wall cluster transcriptional repressor MraZ [Firmicutes bacterium]|nr:division/cell wall cluster transcriptional repressor MraZ [Bacillota bacterium]
MFMGSYENSIDTKARVIIPSKFREELGLECVITRGFDTCLDIYPMRAWEEFEARLKGLPMSNQNARNFARKFRANAVKCEIDKQGRMTIPPALRDFAKIEKDLTTIGNGDKIEVWSRDVWESDEGVGMLEDIDIAEGMEQYGI